MPGITIHVFDQVQRYPDEGALYAEPTFDYLNRSGRPEMERTRNLIEEWFSRYPPEHQEELRSRLRADNVQHGSAVFELTLHELAIRDGLRPVIHPSVPGTDKRPDFLIRDRDGSTLYYLEAGVLLRAVG